MEMMVIVVVAMAEAAAMAPKQYYRSRLHISLINS